jgi:4-amino-4-deoxy-L-arabinose transferase-like glycosyltransferase
MIIAFLKRHKIDAYLALGLFVVALLPRIIGLGTFLTADEKNWIGRSFEFVRAFHDLRFNDMLQTTHPGVTTLWVSGLAVVVKSMISHVQFADMNLIYFVKTTQFSIALLNSLAIPFIFIFLLLLLKNRFLSVLATLFIAFDPFIVGYSRVVHVDVLMGSFLTLAVLASMLYAKYLTRPWLIASAVLSVLAILTKVPAIFILPFIVVALAVYNPKKLFIWDFWKDRIRDASIWVLLGVVITLLIWPALLWVPNPAGNILVLNRDITEAAATPHDSNEDYNLDATHYPYALLDRSNPITLIGACIGVIGIIVLISRKKTPKELLLVCIYMAGFLVMMTLGAKKGDRYIIPSFFALDILAAFGVVWITSFTRTYRKQTLYGVSGIAVLYIIVIIVSYHPYEIAYSNPFFRDNLSQELGWGEGLDQVAAWLNKNHPDAVVASWYPEELGAFTSATVLHINAHTQNPVQYIVLYQNMFGRAADYYSNDFIDEYYEKQTPVFVVKIHGKEYAWVYAKPSYASTVGDLNAQTVAIQEIVVDHDGLAGFQFLPATHFGKSDTGSFKIFVSTKDNASTLYETNSNVKDLKDTQWQQVLFPDTVSIKKGDHVFISIQGIGTSDPYPSIRYSKTDLRTTPIYISRTGSAADAKQKTGTMGMQMLYHGTDGKVATELEDKLLR